MANNRHTNSLQDETTRLQDETAFEDGENRDLLVAEFVEENTYSQTTQFRAGGGILDLSPGRIWFEVSAPVGATWTVTVAPL